MKRGHKIYPFIWFFILSLNLLLGQQSSSYLTQKLMVESDLRSRIASALSKIIDDQKYVIDVNVDIEVTGEKTRMGGPKIAKGEMKAQDGVFHRPPSP